MKALATGSSTWWRITVARAQHGARHPDAVRHVTLLDVLPTLDMWRLRDARFARKHYC